LRRLASTPGLYDEHFGVVQEGVAWFSDPGQGGPPDSDLEVKIQVVAPQYRGTFKDQSFPSSPTPLTVHQGDVANGYIELTNTGTQTWKAGVTKLAPIPRDKPSPFADPSWLSPTRISTVGADVPPGSVGRFDVALDAAAVGDTEVEFGLVEENVTWFADMPTGGGPPDGFLKVHLVVVPPGAPLDAGLPPGDDGGVGIAGDGGVAEEGGEGGADQGWPSTGSSGGCAIGVGASGAGAPPPGAAGFGIALALGAVARLRLRVPPRRRVARRASI
jgi:hypothetical protein